MALEGSIVMSQLKFTKLSSSEIWRAFGIVPKGIDEHRNLNFSTIDKCLTPLLEAAKKVRKKRCE